MAACIVSINLHQVSIGGKAYAPNEEVDSIILMKMRPELDELAPGECRARPVAEAICTLHEKAMQACLEDQGPDGYAPPQDINQETILRCRKALLKNIRTIKQTTKPKIRRKAC